MPFPAAAEAACAPPGSGVRDGSFPSHRQDGASAHVRFTPNSGQTFAPQRNAASCHKRSLARNDQPTFLTGGIVHEPLMMDGLVSLGQYMRNIRMNLPAGAGSQLDSLSDPGESFWR